MANVRLLKSFTSHYASVVALALSADGKFLATSCSDIGLDDHAGHGEVKVWRVENR
jgi:WD40 repeat protein